MQTEERLKEIWLIRKILGDKLFALIDTKNKEYELYNTVFEEWFCTVDIKDDKFRIYRGVTHAAIHVGMGDPDLTKKVREAIEKDLYRSENPNQGRK